MTIYNIGNKISPFTSDFWKEGAPYSKTSIYSLSSGQMPPVNYDSHTFKPHSLTHAESGKHIDDRMHSLDWFIENYPKYFYGEAIVVKFDNNYNQISDNLYKKVISKSELENKLSDYYPVPKIILISTENYPTNKDAYHDENYVLVLSEEAADYLVNTIGAHTFGTSWKSIDHMPDSRERPIHNILLRNGVVFELLNLNSVPEGRYIFSGMPLNIEGSSESPVNPILVQLK